MKKTQVISARVLVSKKLQRVSSMIHRIVTYNERGGEHSYPKKTVRVVYVLTPLYPDMLPKTDKNILPPHFLP